ncbi:MAG: phosphoribosylformylglycinamidine cyclo-ligase, partial [Erysipelotrichaceae bacterium]|nr:phosphoribosylformylglycinamidine cyclo-ligase [Erysipelotrichaceae bacterium]
GVRCVIEKNSYEVPAIFKLLAEKGGIAEDMMYNTFNMGLGMVIAVDAKDVETAMKAIQAAGETCYVVGKVIAGEKGVDLC